MTRRNFGPSTGQKAKSARIPKEVCFGNQKASTPVAKANQFNRFFASVFQKPNLHTTTSTQTATVNGLHLIHTSIEEVRKALKAINPSKAYGPDQIPGRLLKKCTSEFAPSLTHLIYLYVLAKSQRIGSVQTFLFLKKGNNVAHYHQLPTMSSASAL